MNFGNENARHIAANIGISENLYLYSSIDLIMSYANNADFMQVFALTSHNHNKKFRCQKKLQIM